MSFSRSFACLAVLAGMALADGNHEAEGAKKPSPQASKIDLAAKARVEYARTPLSFEPNMGQGDPKAKFIGNSHSYSVKLDATGARFQFKGKDPAASATLGLELVNGNRQAALKGEDLLPGKSDYFPTGDKKTWITDVPNYSRVHYSSVYPGVDVSFYGNSNKLEYDFLIQAGVNPGMVQMKISGSDDPKVNTAGDLVLQRGEGKLHFLKPVAYQMAADGKTRQSVDAAYEVAKNSSGEPVVTFALGKYDHKRELVIDPVVDALSYSQYLNYYYVGAVTVDSSGNAYVTGQAYNSGYAFYVDKFSPTGTQLYTAAFGTGTQAYPYAIAVDSSGDASVTGWLYTQNASTVPGTSNAFQATPGTANQESFVAVLSSTGASLTYCSYVSGGDTNATVSLGLATDSSNNVYIGGWTGSTSFPVTAGAAQAATNPSALGIGWVAKFNPAASSGAASLVYATLLGSTTNQVNGCQQVNRIAVDYAGNAYAASCGGQGFPVTAGAFTYTGYESASGGAYVTKINPTGTAFVYSAYLGYAFASGIAIDAATSGTPSVYVSGTIYGAGEDFPTTAGAYQTSYASGFAVKLSGDGTTELYSTFLSGPSGYTTNGVDIDPTIAVPIGCASNCNAYIAGRTNTSDWPLVNPVQAQPASGPYSAFITELNSTGTAALFSSYFSGYNAQVYRAQDSLSFGVTPAIAVDGSGNIYLAGNTTQAASNSDLPTTIPYTYGNSQGFLAKISASATAGFILAQPSSISFGTVSIGSTSPISTIRLNNYGGTAITGMTIAASPASVFAETDTCNGTIPAGGECILDVTFTPNAPSARTGALTITSSASNSPATVTLTGSGQDSGYNSVSVSSLTFANQAIGTTSAAQTFTLTNTGDETTSTTISTNAPQQFVPISNCPSQLAPGATCTISVTFSPSQPGLYLQTLYIQNSSGPTFTVALSGTGVVSGAPTSITPNVSSLQFDPQTVGTSSNSESFIYTNTGSEPIAINSIAASGPFSITYLQYGTPFTLSPQQTFQVNVIFVPTTAGAATGSIALNTSVSSSPLLVSLSGTALASTQTYEFYPSTAITFPDTPQGTIGATETIYFQNLGTSPITMDRVFASSGFKITYSSCGGNIINPGVSDGTGASQGTCQINVEFTPSATATGLQTGTLTFVDSASGSPQIVNLSGNAITATGTIAVAPSLLTFGPQPQGVTSGIQYLYLQNPGNTAVTVTGVSFSGTNGTDYTAGGSNCGAFPFAIPAAPATQPNSVSSCYVPIQFTPGGTGTRTATFTVSSSAGNATASLTGTGETATQAVELIPTSLNLGSIVTGQGGNYEGIYLYNAGTETVTFTATAAITGTNAADFTLSNGCATNGNTIAVGATCNINVRFTPTTTGAESATLTFTDSAGTQTFALSGTGVASTPTYTTSIHAIAYPTQLVGSTSSLSYYTYFSNNGSTSVTLGNATVTGAFLIPHGDDTCSGQTIGAGGSCYVYVEFAPTAAGYSTGSLTFNGASGTPLTGAPVLPLTGYAVTSTYSAFVNPTTNKFAEFQVIGTTSGSDVTYLYNTGNTPFTVATVTGTNFGLAGATSEFSIASANGGYDACSNQTVQPGSSCQVNITFTPNAAGTQTGTISFPITYSNSTTANITGNLTGTGIAEKNSAVLTPPNGAFVDQAVGVTTSYNVTAYLNNNGNLPFTVGILTDTNSTEFSTASSLGGYDSCSGATVQTGSACQINVRFTPSATGTRTGSIGFPVTFADHTTTTATLSLTGPGVASAKTIAITASSLNFGTEIQGATTATLGLSVTNTGNVPVTIGTDTISTNSTEFAISSDSCRGATIQPNNNTCTIYVTFTPSSTATGTQSGVLTIADNATGGPHTVPLTGIAITAAQQLLVSPTTLAFGNQPAASISSVQTFYVTNQGDNSLTSSGWTLGGTNASDFAIVNNQCSTNLNPHTTCYINVQFSPPTGTTGALTATISETDSGTPGTHTVTLTGTAVTPGPAATLSPSTIAFAKQNVGSTSATQAFSLTNTGSANLNITAVTSTNATEFPIYSDGCSGTSLAPNTHCTVSLQFSPTLGGNRTGSITITDNASGSPQSVAVSGLGYGIPVATYTPTSLTFGNTNIGSSSATQTITLKNTGTDTLNISGISLTGGNANQFSQTNTCATTLAPAASCVITAKFSPTAAGSQSAYVTVSDNANNIAGSTQSTPLSGTGVAVPTAATSPTTLTFASTNIGVSSAVQTSTLTNSGTGPLTIASIAIGGTNLGDYSQTNNCGSTLLNGSSCLISVTFKPTASGTRTATVTVTDNANGTAGSTQTVLLTGTGAGLPGAAVSPSSLTFTDQNVGTSSTAQTITLSNSGTGALTIASIALSGTNAADYSTTNTCAGSVAAAGSCTISVTFKPTSGGTRTATLTVTDNANNTSGSTQTASLSGTGVGVPAASVSPTSLSFASTTQGQSTNAQSVTLTNGGTAALSITGISIVGANATDFTETTTCGTSLAAGSNCGFSVTFTPTGVGTRKATLQIVDNAGNTGAAQSVPLSGTGVAIAAPTIVSLSPNSGTGLTQTFTSVYSDPGGASDLKLVNIMFNTIVTSPNGCYVQYKPGNNGLYLENTAGTATTGPIVPGSSSTLSNSACTLSGTGSSVTTSGNTMTVALNITFSSSFTGAKYVFLYAQGSVNNSGWVKEGTWTGSLAPPPAIVSLSPSSGSGLSQAFTTVFSDPAGASALQSVYTIFNASLTSSHGCRVGYTSSTNTLSLENDAGNGLVGTVTPGSTGTLSNSQCTLSGTGSSVSTSGNNLTVVYAITFTSTFTGSKNVYLYAADANSNTGFVLEGTWTP